MNKIQNDTVAVIDSLGRRKFASQIVKSITCSFENIDESIVIGICGKWGSGKTTLLAYVENEIQQYYNCDAEKFKIIHFNPWTSSEQEEMQRDLLETILKELEGINWKTSINKTNEKIKNYLKYFEHLKYLKYIHPVATNIFDAIEEYRIKANLSTTVELKEEINNLIKEKEIKIYIMLDDLDRLDPVQITSIFKTVKLNVNFLNTCYFIAYDKEVVINALKETYHDNAEDYLEKIIQADFTVPELLEEQLEELFFEKLNANFTNLELKISQQEVFSLWKYYGLREFFRSPRDIKRYFNSLILSLPNVGDNVNLLDFIALEAIKVFDYNSYGKLYSSVIEIKRKSVWASAVFGKDTIETFENNSTQSLLNYLFVNTLSNYPFGEPLNRKRLKDHEYFERYFSLNISRTDISEETLTLFLTPGSNKKWLLKDAYEYGRIKNLLRRLGDREIGDKFEISDYKIFYDFLDFWEENHRYITSELDEYIWHAYFNLAHSFKDKHKAAQTAINALLLNFSSFQPMRIVFNHFILHFHETGRHNQEFYGEVKSQIDISIQKLKKEFIENMQKTWGNYFHIINQGESYFPSKLFFYSYSKYCKDEYIKELNSSISNPNFLIFLLKDEFVLINSNTNEPFRINLSNKDIYLPGLFFNEFIMQLEKMKTGSLNENDQVIVNYFLEEVNE